MPTLQGVPSPYVEGIFDDMVSKESEAKWSAVFETNKVVHIVVLFVSGED